MGILGRGGSIHKSTFFLIIIFLVLFLDCPGLGLFYIQGKEFWDQESENYFSYFPLFNGLYDPGKATSFLSVSGYIPIGGLEKITFASFLVILL